MMNKNQRIVLGVGLLFVILNGLFPPFDWTIGHYDFTKPSEYHHACCFIFAPPDRAEINLTRFFIQFITIVVATAGAFFLFGVGGKKATTQDEEKMSTD
jgi:hypothetical protein